MSEQEQNMQEVEAVAETDASSEADLGIVSESKPSANKGALMLFGLLAIGGAVIWAIHHRGAARAEEDGGSVRTASAAQTISSFLSTGDDSRRLMEQALKNTEKVVQQFLNYPSSAQVPLSDLRTNPFHHEGIKAPTGPIVDDSAEKKRREEQRLAAIKAVQQLQLQSVILSDKMRACMIDNKMYQEGQVAGEFTIEKINPNAVIVKTGAYRFELRMQK